METLTLFPGAETAPVQCAASFLQMNGWHIADCPSDLVTHLLLPIPSFDQNGYIKGSNHDLEGLLRVLPRDICVIGGNLDSTAIPQIHEIHTIDLLKNEAFLAENAAVTAHCALKVALRQMGCTLQELPVLVIGWGRIGKCLARLLRALGARVTVAARKETDRAMLQALMYQSCSIDRLCTQASQFDLIFNTVPYPVLDTASCKENAILLELASRPGIIGAGVTDARGLPGKEAPLTSGALIGKTILRITTGKEHTS